MTGIIQSLGVLSHCKALMSLTAQWNGAVFSPTVQWNGAVVTPRTRNEKALLLLDLGPKHQL